MWFHIADVITMWNFKSIDQGFGGYGSPKSGVSHWLWLSLLLTCYGATLWCKLLRSLSPNRLSAKHLFWNECCRPIVCRPKNNSPNHLHPCSKWRWIRFGVRGEIQSKDYKDEFKCVTKSALGDMFAFCTLCRSDVNIAHMVGCG